jgi:hypothetical protein
MSPSFVPPRRVDKLLALQLRVLEDAVSLVVTLEAKTLLMVSLTLLKC